MNSLTEEELAVLREAIQAMVDEFTGVGAIAGYTLPAGMSIDPESLSLRGKSGLNRDRKVPRRKRKRA